MLYCSTAIDIAVVNVLLILTLFIIHLLLLQLWAVLTAVDCSLDVVCVIRCMLLHYVCRPHAPTLLHKWGSLNLKKCLAPGPLTASVAAAVGQTTEGSADFRYLEREYSCLSYVYDENTAHSWLCWLPSFLLLMYQRERNLLWRSHEYVMKYGDISLVSDLKVAAQQRNWQRGSEVQSKNVLLLWW